jgi:hypothetical protein
LWLLFENPICNSTLVRFKVATLPAILGLENAASIVCLRMPRNYDKRHMYGFHIFGHTGASVLHSRTSDIRLVQWERIKQYASESGQRAASVAVGDHQAISRARFLVDPVDVRVLGP